MTMWPVSRSIALLVLGLVNMPLVTCFVVPDSHLANKQGGISQTKRTRRWFVIKQENDHFHTRYGFKVGRRNEVAEGSGKPCRDKHVECTKISTEVSRSGCRQKITSKD
eukprot:scaffold105084_cov67-Attheya_sp.AAC.2